MPKIWLWFENTISPIPEKYHLVPRKKNNLFGYSTVLDNPMSSHALDKTHKELIDSFMTCQPSPTSSVPVVWSVAQSPQLLGLGGWRSTPTPGHPHPTGGPGGPGGPPSPGIIPGLVGQAGRVSYEDLGRVPPRIGDGLTPVVRFHRGGVTFTCYWTMCYWPLPIIRTCIKMH